MVLSDFCRSARPWCSQICGANTVKQLYTYYTVVGVIVVICFSATTLQEEKGMTEDEMVG